MLNSALLSGTAWLPLADAIAKATLLLATGALLAVALRRASAAARHLVWTLALGSALVLPALSLALPRWQVPIVTLSPAASWPEGQHYNNTSDSGVAQRAADRPGSLPAPELRMDRGAPLRSAAPAGAALATIATALPAPVSTRPSWGALLLVAWALGAAVVLGRLAAGLLAVWWMSRCTDRVTDAPWLPLARALAAELGLSPRILFLRSGRAAMPMAWGILRPAVLMPADADAWPAERLRIVLLHELAHVKRRDCLTHVVAQIACALYWFNPLAWVAAKHLRVERERACDDLVLAAGTPGADYADQLLVIARVMRSGRFPAVLAGASLAMAHRSQLEGRLMAILDPSVPRSGVTRAAVAAATALFACASMPLASLQPWTYAAEQSPTATGRPGRHYTVPGGPEDPHSPAPGRPEGRHYTTPQYDVVQRSIDTSVEAGIQKGVQAGVQKSVEAAVQKSVQAGILEGVDAAVQSATGAINAIVNANINTNINSNINAHVNAHSHGSADDGQDEHRKAADPSMVAALTAALKDTDKDVRQTALQALVQLRDPSIYEPLIQALKDAAPDVREQAAFGLGQLRDRRAVDPLVNALKDSSADVREQAAFALGQLRDRSAIAGLTSAVKDSSDSVREQAVFALGQLRDPGSVEALGAALHDTKPDVREQAAFSLGQIRDRRAVEPLISALKDSNADVREQAAFALGQIRDRGAVEGLVIALKDSAANVREQAAFALGQIRDPRAIDGLTGALKDPSKDVRQQAAFALGQLAR